MPFPMMTVKGIRDQTAWSSNWLCDEARDEDQSCPVDLVRVVAIDVADLRDPPCASAETSGRNQGAEIISAIIATRLSNTCSRL